MVCRLLLLPLLLTGLCNCAGLKAAAIMNADSDLHDQVRMAVKSNGAPGAGSNAKIGKISKSMAPDDPVADSIKGYSYGVSRLRYEGVDDDKICFSHTFAEREDWEPGDVSGRLLKWRWAVGGHRSFGEFAGPDARWPFPSTSAFTSARVVKNSVEVVQRDGLDVRERHVIVSMCGPAPTIGPDANWLAVTKVNPNNNGDNSKENEIFLWAITDAETFDTGFKPDGILDGFDFPADPPAGKSAAPTAPPPAATP
jgi:hypothetical protein